VPRRLRLFKQLDGAAARRVMRSATQIPSRAVPTHSRRETTATTLLDSTVRRCTRLPTDLRLSNGTRNTAIAASNALACARRSPCRFPSPTPALWSAAQHRNAMIHRQQAEAARPPAPAIRRVPSTRARKSMTTYMQTTRARCPQPAICNKKRAMHDATSSILISTISSWNGLAGP